MAKDERNEIKKELLELLPKDPHGRLHIAPRTGKTGIVISLIKRDNPKSILWVTPTTELAEKDVPEEFTKWHAKKYLKKLTCITWRGLEKAEGYYDLIVLDEEQFITKNNSKTLRNGKLSYNNIISMTGTPSREFDKYIIYTALKLEILYKLSVVEATNLDILSNYIINVIKVAMSSELNLEVKTKNHNFKTSESKSYDYLSSQIENSDPKDRFFKIIKRLGAVQESKSKFNAGKYLMDNLPGRKIIFCPRATQAETLCKDYYHGKSNSESLKKFIKGNIDSIAMVNKGGTGYTYKEVDHIIILQADSDKSGLTSQKIARALLKQENHLAIIWIICLNATQDEKWVERTLNRFDRKKVRYIDFNHMKRAGL